DRFHAYGWHVLRIEDGNDIAEIDRVIDEARTDGEHPTLVVIRTHIAYGSPNKQDTAAAHGAPLGEEEVLATWRSGIAAVCRRQGLEWINMTREPATWRDFPDNKILKRIAVPRILEEALLLTVPVMKTHAKTTLTGALKNQWGCLPTMRHEYHLVLDDALADLNSVFRPVLALMDGTVGLEGNGPKSGRPRIADTILCSTDPVALDTIQAILMGLDPQSVAHLATCSARGIGVSDRAAIEVKGIQPEENVLNFAPAGHNAVSAIETLLRRSWLKWLFFNTPLFRACLLGAKMYYIVWTWLRAKALWAPIRRHPVYGPQWSADWPGLEGR
ncbi:MAG: DUF362 domain-containing protein, partial [Acidobacteria bacterium]|nr:DUF362 domain-containing protein [Acidobacteriota bacterium]